MSKKNKNAPVVEEQGSVAVKQPKKKTKKGGLFGRIVRRFFLLLLTLIVLLVVDLCLVLNLIFNGPSPAMQERLTMSLIEASATKWVPALFIGEERVAEIRTPVDNAELTQGVYALFSIPDSANLLRTVIYAVVMTALYFMSYVIQQRWVFAPQKSK